MDEEFEKLKQEFEKFESFIDGDSENRKDLESELNTILQMKSIKSYFPNF